MSQKYYIMQIVRYQRGLKRNIMLLYGLADLCLVVNSLWFTRAARYGGHTFSVIYGHRTQLTHGKLESKYAKEMFCFVMCEGGRETCRVERQKHQPHRKSQRSSNKTKPYPHATA